MGRKRKTIPPGDLLPPTPALRSAYAALASLAALPSEQRPTRLISAAVLLPEVVQEMIQMEVHLLDLAKAAAISGFRSGMDLFSYPSEGPEKAIWDILRKHGEGLLNRTLCDLLAEDGIDVPHHLAAENREDWWHALERSHSVATYISRQRTAFGRWASADRFYREYVASRKSQ